MTTHFEKMMQVGNRGLSKAEMEILASFHLEDNDMEWQNQAYCRDSGVDFFPEQQVNTKILIATKFCNQCPVKQQCLDFAMNNRIDYGIWGGKTAANRRSLRRYRYRRAGKDPSLPVNSVVL